MRLCIVAIITVKVAAHSALTIPSPRNAIDNNEKPWGGPVPVPLPFEPWCPIPSKAAAGKDDRNLTGANAQACFWFSNGCAIGCDECDGSTRGPIPRFTCTEKTCTPTGQKIKFGPQDYFFYSPWRAPGYAPVIDSCGVAGGRLPGQGPGGYGAQFVNTTHAKLGDLGSRTLPVRDNGVRWQAGSEYEVAWTLQANHGGGYSYRLCALEEEAVEEDPAWRRPLDEACFNTHPLQMVGQSILRWGGVGGRTLSFDAVDVTTGTKNHEQTGWGFQPVCEDEGEDKQGTAQSCTGMWGPYNLEIVDKVLIPKHLPAGNWVLNWRMDQEESNQIWQSCADVTIVSARM